ncbi:MAG: M16 family metallopeptidase, partial [Hyphococcus sp.]
MKAEIRTLKNGLRIVLDPMPSLETAALGVWACAGSADERDGEHGVAHLLEHMAFKGTKRRSARAIAEEIESVGGYLNAATSHQRTGYYARVLKDDVALGLDLLADILRNPVFAAQELAKEREVVVQEIGEAADTPDDVVFELLQEATWEGHPLARPILGTPESVRAQSADSLRGFMGRLYRPDAMIVAA